VSRLLRLAPAALAALLGAPPAASAQRVEVAPFVGVRVGGDIYESVVSAAVDTDGAPSAGAVVDVRLWPDTALSLLFTRQQPQVEVRASLLDPPVVLRVTVDHIQAGGTYELNQGRARPFLSGLLGATVYGLPGDTEVRFSLSGGGGVKLFPTRHVGLRLDGRVFATIGSLSTTAGICGGYGCVLGIDGSLFWQAEATAGVVFAF
jgi:hypothetical protein